MELLTYGRREDMKLIQQDRAGWDQPKAEDFQP